MRTIFPLIEGKVEKVPSGGEGQIIAFVERAGRGIILQFSYLSEVKALFRKIFRFLSHGVWTIDDSKLNRSNRYLVKLIRIIILAVEDFGEKKLILQASALTFYTLLSVVPVVAMVFGIAKGFGLEERLREQLYYSFSEEPQLLEQLLSFVNRLLANTQGGLVAGLGFIILIWSVLQVLSSIEMSFNSIWQITVNRSWVRKFTDYFSILLLAPVFFIAAGSATLFISAFITDFAQRWISLGFLRDIIIFSINLIPYVLNALLFMLVYMIIPNTRVRLKPAIVAGIVAGFSFQLFQWGYIEFQVGVSRYNAIYGSFAFFPLFITFLQVAWIIVLIGAEVSYSLQNIEMHVDERQHFIPSNKQKLVLALTIMALSAKRFEDGGPSYSAQEWSQELDLPFKVIKEFCNELCKAGLLSEIVASDEESETSYQPAIGVDRLNVSFVMNRLDEISPIEKTFTLPEPLRASEELVEKLYRESTESKLNIHVLSIFGADWDS
ncbi:MAG: YihY family inner membrane protein [Bacteroidetes bacterium]|nr:YihY family inner membrane protein [Bacteroidota bacterium]